MMRARRKVLFLQLPQVDNDVSEFHENLKLAGVYLRHAMEQSGEDAYYEPVIAPAETDNLDDRHLAEFIVDCRPIVIAATLYLWNVERSLRVLRLVRRKLAGVRIAVGGPEVAVGHPFLFKSLVPDVAVVGEGEAVFPAVLRAFRTGHLPDLRSIAWRSGRKYVRGSRAVPSLPLRKILPSPEYDYNRPDKRGMAYLETSRGCAWRCAFCCYNQRRRGVSYLDAADVLDRVRTLGDRGAREMRFIDPTFNSNPDFERILAGLASLNRNRRLSFFAELRAGSLTPGHCRMLAHANFKQVEVGVQSRDSDVLRSINRSADLISVDRGIRYLSGAGVRITLDIMCGLPRQSAKDISVSLREASKVKTADVQFLHTLLLPGTELRDCRRKWRLKAQALPPYRVLETAFLSSCEIAHAEDLARRLSGRRMDCQARRFVGTTLPDCFRERVRVDVDAKELPATIPGKENRRAVIIRGTDLWSRRDQITKIIKLAAKHEPHTLWQFVLSPIAEEPLDLLDVLIAGIDSFPEHFLDRMTATGGSSVRASRRIFILLRKTGEYSRSWIEAAERTLNGSFH